MEILILLQTDIIDVGIVGFFVAVIIFIIIFGFILLVRSLGYGKAERNRYKHLSDRQKKYLGLLERKDTKGFSGKNINIDEEDHLESFRKFLSGKISYDELNKELEEW